jgi:hypothetical protein
MQSALFIINVINQDLEKYKKMDSLKKRIRVMIWLIIVGLALSGLTAFPLETEIGGLLRYSTVYPDVLSDWLGVIYSAIKETNRHYPYLAYGTDWLAFAHLMLAVLFVGPLRDPIRNIWVIEFGMIACVAIIPLALIAGHIRQIPFFWRLIDCSFGLIAIVPLILCHQNIHRLKALKNNL